MAFLGVTNAPYYNTLSDSRFFSIFDRALIVIFISLFFTIRWLFGVIIPPYYNTLSDSCFFSIFDRAQLKKRMDLIESQMTYPQQLFPSQKPKEVLIFFLSNAYLYIICICIIM